MWVNRSILGLKTAQGDMQIQPFDDMASEQSSLEMVFQGLVVELSWEPVKPNPLSYMGTGSDGGGYLGVGSDADARQAEEERVAGLVRIKLTVKVPNLEFIRLDLDFVATEKRNSLFNWSYVKAGKGDGLVSESGRSRSRRDSGQPSFDLKENMYNLAWSETFSREDVGHDVQLELRFSSDRIGSVGRDFLKMEVL